MNLYTHCSRFQRIMLIMVIVSLVTTFTVIVFGTVAAAQNFVVTNTNNDGAGSLREAIVNANATPGTDTISFNIPGTGVQTISLVTALPDITDPVVIDGTTQPGYSGSPLVEINGLAISNQTGLGIRAGGSTVRGLAIGNFSSSTAIAVSDCDNNVFQANYIGVDAAGTTARPNDTGISLSNSKNNLIGGTTAVARNVISGNHSRGIFINGSNNVVQGNYIGTNAAGTDSFGFGTSGIDLSGIFVGNNLIGGTASGAGNLISGLSRGISIFGSGTTVQGNLIGTDVTGTKKISNTNNGILTFEATNTIVGGLTPGARNIISGNSTGIRVSGAGSKVQGNFIGTDITGTQPLGNNGSGVSAANGVLVGGATPEARNVIAANGGNVSLGENNSGVGVTVQGNYIGTDVTGTKALASNTLFGISISTNGHLIGGSAPGEQNVISGNMIGIAVGRVPGPAISGTVIKGNIIGLNAQGTAPLPNTQLGVQYSTAQNNTLGGVENGAANKIAFNGGPGVLVLNGTDNSIRGNSIFSNTGLGIDLNAVSGTPTGVTPNDPNDTDLGANNLQNFPVITTVSSNASSTTILGNLNSTPNTVFQIDFYSNAAVDLSGNGEGGLFFGTTAVTTNASGNAVIDVTFPIALPAGRVITATATDPNGNTSEFSAADPTGAIGSVQFNFNSFFVIEDVGVATVTVERTGGSSGNVSVQFETTNGTATAGQDYTAASGTLNFANGEISKTIQIPIANDDTTEPDETFTLALKNPSSLDVFGSPISMTITIQDRTTVPALLVFSTSVTEGNLGTVTESRFEVRLSAATGRTVTVSYTTNIGNAHGGAACGTPGVDYQSTSGSLVFQPGSFQKFVPVNICGDNSAELNEGFFFDIFNPNNATIADTPALGTILNDDEIQLVLEESSPIVNHAAALDSIFYLRDPFRVVSVPELFATTSGDRNTRVILFVRNLELNPGENSSVLIVRLVSSTNLPFDVFAEDFRPVPNTDLMQLVFRVPTNFPAGASTIFIRAHGRISNLGTIRIAP
ncbi:MAG TPA: Calx-beta domain-containing protein [Pyrinomonadaceae bacterium]|nr:Calx-beta domain-containing protein [Pyrinomonadaceae bacterium]